MIRRKPTTCGTLTAAQVATLRLNGASCADIAKLAFVSEKAVASCLQKSGVAGKRGGARKGERWKERHAATIRERA